MAGGPRPKDMMRTGKRKCKEETGKKSAPKSAKAGKSGTKRKTKK